MFTVSKLIGMTDNDIVMRIAQKIRATRIQKNLTIQQLAQRMNVSKGLLSKIENSRTIPSLPVFVSLIQSLDMSLKDFFHDIVLLNGKPYLHIKQNDTVNIDKEGRPGFQYQYLLSQALPSCVMESAILTLEPGATGSATTTDGYELKYIISGTCEYSINNETLVLEEGDALYFDASLPHVPANRTRRKVVMLVMYFLFSRNG